MKNINLNENKKIKLKDKKIWYKIEKKKKLIFLWQIVYFYGFSDNRLFLL